MLDITSKRKMMILEEEIKHALMSISKYSLNVNSIVFSLWIINEFGKKKTSKVRNILNKYRRQIMLTAPI